MINSFNFQIKDLENLFSEQEDCLYVLNCNRDLIIKAINKEFYNNYKMYIYLLLFEKVIKQSEQKDNIVNSNNYMELIQTYINNTFKCTKQFISTVKNLNTLHSYCFIPLFYDFKEITRAIVYNTLYKFIILNNKEIKQEIKIIKKNVYFMNVLNEDVMLARIYSEVTE